MKIIMVSGTPAGVICRSESVLIGLILRKKTSISVENGQKLDEFGQKYYSLVDYVVYYTIVQIPNSQKFYPVISEFFFLI